MATEIKQTATGTGTGDSQTLQIGQIFGNVSLAEQPKKVEFVTLPLEQFSPPRFPCPCIISELYKRVKNFNLLVLGGTDDLDKDDLARHIAWYTKEQLLLSAETKDTKRRSVVEWRRSTEARGLSATIRTTNEPTIFVLPQLEPKDVGYDLNSLQKAAVEAKDYHYVIISTNKSLAGWKLDPGAKSTIWYDLPPHHLWETDKLATALITILQDNRDLLPAHLVPQKMEVHQKFVGQLSYQEVAQCLETPTNVFAFVRLLRAEKEPDKVETVRNLVEQVRGGERRLKQWYHTQLDAEEQLLALGVCLLDGLYDDQFFAAMERLLDDVWRKRSPFMKAFDYGDLDNLGNILTPFESSDSYPTVLNHSSDNVSAANYQPKIEIRDPEWRQKLLRVTWHSHRRWILATLPALADIVTDSVADQKIGSSELFDNSTRCQWLRAVISDTLSELGLIAPPAVERTLIELAADEQIAVQAVVANAMARWRNRGRDDVLFDTLQRWQREARYIDQISSIHGKEKDSLKQPLAYIRATVALTVSFAAQYDPPNQLSEKLCELLKDLADDTTFLVRDRFREHTLLWVVPVHLVQLRDFLHDLPSKYPRDFYSSTAQALARAYEVNPGEVEKTIEMWLREGRDKRPAGLPEQPGQREALMATAILTYGYIWFDRRIGSLDITQRSFIFAGKR